VRMSRVRAGASGGAAGADLGDVAALVDVDAVGGLAGLDDARQINEGCREDFVSNLDGAQATRIWARESE
jgi:hypothetical protein